MADRHYRPPSPLRSLNWNRLRATWNLNRYWLILGNRLYVARSQLSKELELRNGPDLWEISSTYFVKPFRRLKNKQRGAKPDVLVVAEHGRFGNSFRQIIQALAVADLMGAKEVIAKDIPLLPKGSWVISDGLRLTHDHSLRPDISPNPSLVLAGDFFVRPRLPVDIEGYEFQSFQRRLSEAYGFASVPPLSQGTMVVHLRSGDIFGERPHSDMRQPPLAFYVRAIMSASPDHIVLVYEDELNPVIRHLREWIEKKGISCETQSRSLQSDLETLMAARTLVMGQGSFGPAVIALSPNLERLYTFGPAGPLRFPPLRVGSQHFIYDESGEYESAMNPWRNTPEQRSMMINFDEKKLSERIE